MTRRLTIELDDDLVDYLVGNRERWSRPPRMPDRIIGACRAALNREATAPQPRLYSEILDDEVAEMAASWDKTRKFLVHAAIWLNDHGFDMDPTKSHDENGADFIRLADRAIDTLAARQ